MKLNEIKPVLQGHYDLSEGVIPVTLTMTLEQIVRDGKVTNNVQYFIMAALIEMYKNGGPTRWPRDLNSYEMCTSASVIEDVKAFQPAEAVGISIWLLNELQRTGSFESNPYSGNPHLSAVEWTKMVLRRQN